jgi:hypothetical protein
MHRSPPVVWSVSFAQRYVVAVPWDDMQVAITALTRTNAFIRPEDGDDKGMRLAYLMQLMPNTARPNKRIPTVFS